MRSLNTFFVIASGKRAAEAPVIRCEMSELGVGSRGVMMDSLQGPGHRFRVNLTAGRPVSEHVAQVVSGGTL